MVSMTVEKGKVRYELGISDFLLFISIIIGNVGLVLAYQETSIVSQFTVMSLVLFQIHYILRMLGKLRSLKRTVVK